MMKGEFVSLSTIHSLLPTLVPHPFGWDQLKSTPGTSFLLMEFLNLANDLPGPPKLAERVAEMHRLGTSTTGKFGFHTPNCHGKMVQNHYWDDNWCRYFTWLLTSYFEEELRVNGPYPEFERAFSILREHVIPRLLGPLQADGRTLTPRVVHGDLWHNNVGINRETGQVVLYYPDAWYAHREFELGMWRCDYVKSGGEYLKEYLKLFPASEQAGDFDGRNRLYSLKYNISHSFHWPSGTAKA